MVKSAPGPSVEEFSDHFALSCRLRPFIDAPGLPSMHNTFHGLFAQGNRPPSLACRHRGSPISRGGFLPHFCSLAESSIAERTLGILNYGFF